MSGPFVVTVASEKGGVGKTTIATNLAVYLKALREDLPVTIASFDNHFSVDQMFALGPRPAHSVAGLLEEKWPENLLSLGQYGVQYVGSARRLQPPDQPPDLLRQRLRSSTLSGILILDTRPILDWFTEAALLAADLVLLPVKDRASLVNAGALRQVLAEVGRADRLCLLPSLVDTRARLNSDLRVHEFLSYAARERDYQVLDICISKSPKVESLSSGFSSSIKPVLTHARNTAVHAQLKKLAEHLLSQFDLACDSFNALSGDRSTPLPSAPGAKPARHLVPECPCCCQSSFPGPGHFYFDIRSRRRGFVHPGCFATFASALQLESEDSPEASIVLTIDGPGLVAPDCQVVAHLCDSEQGVLCSTELSLDGQQAVSRALEHITGRSLDSAYRELIMLSPAAADGEIQLSDSALRNFSLARRQLIRALRDAGLV